MSSAEASRSAVNLSFGRHSQIFHAMITAGLRRKSAATPDTLPSAPATTRLALLVALGGNALALMVKTAVTYRGLKLHLGANYCVTSKTSPLCLTSAARAELRARRTVLMYSYSSVPRYAACFTQKVSIVKTYLFCWRSIRNIVESYLICYCHCHVCHPFSQSLNSKSQ